MSPPAAIIFLAFDHSPGSITSPGALPMALSAPAILLLSAEPAF